MSLEMAATSLISYGALATRGASDTARFVAEQAELGRRHLQSSHSIGMGGRGVFDELSLVADECSAEKWDGYGAGPVGEENFKQAYRVFEALPLGTPLPSV